MEISKIISLSTACSSGHAFRVLQENKQPAESYIGDGGAEAQFGSLQSGQILLWNLLQADDMSTDPLLTLLEPSMQAVRPFWKQPKKQQCCVGHFGRCDTNIRDKEPRVGGWTWAAWGPWVFQFQQLVNLKKNSTDHAFEEPIAPEEASKFPTQIDHCTPVFHITHHWAMKTWFDRAVLG